MRHSIRIAVGPVQFRIGSDWAEPIDALGRLYAAYPQDDARPAERLLARLGRDPHWTAPRS